MNLAGSYAVSGAAGDIGRAVCSAIAQAGGQAHGGDVRSAPGLATVDVTDAAAVQAWVAGIPDLRGAVVNAATVAQGSLRTLDPADWRRDLEVGLTGAFLLARAVAERLAREGGGSIVMVGSWAAHAIHRQVPAYSVAKAGLRMLTRTLAAEYASERVRINELAPGFVDAGLSAQLFARDPGLRARCAAEVPLGELLPAATVADEVVALLDPRRSQLTGATLVLDGGLSVGRR